MTKIKENRQDECATTIKSNDWTANSPLSYRDGFVAIARRSITVVRGCGWWCGSWDWRLWDGWTGRLGGSHDGGVQLAQWWRCWWSFRPSGIKSSREKQVRWRRRRRRRRLDNIRPANVQNTRIQIQRRPSFYLTTLIEVRYDVALDTKQFNLETLYRATTSWLYSTEKTKSKPGETTTENIRWTYVNTQLTITMSCKESLCHNTQNL